MSRKRNVKSLRVSKKYTNPTPVHLRALYFVMKLHSIVCLQGKPAPTNQTVVFLKFKPNARMSMQRSCPCRQELHLTLREQIVLNPATKICKMPQNGNRSKCLNVLLDALHSGHLCSVLWITLRKLPNSLLRKSKILQKPLGCSHLGRCPSYRW